MPTESKGEIPAWDQDNDRCAESILAPRASRLPAGARSWGRRPANPSGKEKESSWVTAARARRGNSHLENTVGRRGLEQHRRVLLLHALFCWDLGPARPKPLRNHTNKPLYPAPAQLRGSFRAQGMLVIRTQCYLPPPGGWGGLKDL